MLLPTDIKPKYSLYYIGGILLKEMNEHSEYDFFTLYHYLKKDYTISFRSYILAVDWLYLINVIEVKEDGGMMYVSRTA